MDGTYEAYLRDRSGVISRCRKAFSPCTSRRFAGASAIPVTPPLTLKPCHVPGYIIRERRSADDGLASKQRVLERDPSSATVHLQIALSYPRSLRREIRRFAR
jgi:hypothetical protein